LPSRPFTVLFSVDIFLSLELDLDVDIGW
jgi:hypothetical protein